MTTMSLLSFAKDPGEPTLLNEVKNASSTVYNDTKEVLSTVYGDIKSLAPSIESFLSDVATSLNKGVSEVWGYLVLQQTVISITYLLFIIIGIVGTTQGIKLYNKNFLNLKIEENLDKPLALYTFIIFSAGAVSSYIGISHIYEIITGLVNPEYGALMHILEQLQKFN